METKSVQATDGMWGFDCNAALSFDKAKAFASHTIVKNSQVYNYKFVCRYIPRVSPNSNDLTQTEILDIFNAGLAISPVQHVEMGYWFPNGALGEKYGKNAASYCMNLAIAPTTCVSLDLESVSVKSKTEDIIEYCNTWWDHVDGSGFTPMLYLGWDNRLTADEAYHRLKFQHYWGAYNLNSDMEPSVRGIQMKQHEQQIGDYPLGIHLPIDLDVVHKDKLGGLPIFYAKDDWS